MDLEEGTRKYVAYFHYFDVFGLFLVQKSRRYKNIRYTSLFFSLLSLPSPFRFSFR